MYLILFVLVLLVPQIFPNENIESLTLFILGMIGFGFFQLRERELKKHVADKRRYQREANNASKDLVHSYSYIGEINRQLEILKNIALRLPKTELTDKKQRQEAFDAILEAIMVFARAESFALRFINIQEKKCAEEMRVGEREFSVSNELLAQQKKESTEIDGCSVVRASRATGGYIAYILIDRKTIAPEDVDFLRAIASQALFLFAWERDHQI
jgi:hypothetical protein